jgi:hypothetical protein
MALQIRDFNILYRKSKNNMQLKPHKVNDPRTPKYLSDVHFIPLLF